MPNDEIADAEEIHRRALLREMAWLQAKLAHERTIAARDQGDLKMAGECAGLALDWVDLWLEMAIEEDENAADADLAAATAVVKHRRRRQSTQ
jgi:hypothetical protein